MDYVPKKGYLLDIGTGFGLLPLLLGMQAKKLDIVAIDLDDRRIGFAKKASKNFQNIQFKTGRIDTLKLPTTFTTVTIIDVLYLLPKAEKIKIIRKTRRLLKPGGLVFIKINNRSLNLTYFFTWLQEKITVHFLGETATNFSGLYFETPAEIAEVMRNNGFRVKNKIRLKTPFPFFHHHWLIVGEKN
jgi:2-polyprenyl-3-methyl-5-hydroxy-6-metoxy-1,4-benzoquinol methylase